MSKLFSYLEPDDESIPLVKGWKLILGYAGYFMFCIGIFLFLPLLNLIWFPEDSSYALDFIIPGACFLLVGALLYFLLIHKKRHAQLETHQDAFIVLLCWLLSIFACIIPFMTSGLFDFSQAVFETTSGLTTTGLSIVADYETFPKIFFLYRSFTHLVGGIGLILIMISALSDRYGMRLYSSEGHYDKFLPNVIKSSRTILIIYFGFILAGIIGFCCCGLRMFDAINYSISAVATGGFGVHAENIGYYDSIGVEVVAIVLMLLGSINFLAHIYLFKGKFKNFFNYAENKTMLLILAIFIPVASMGLFYTAASSMSMSEAWRIGAFQVISALSTAGLQNTTLVASGVNQTSSALLFILIICMWIGGQTNSTAGGIKIFRINIMFKSIYMKIRNSLAKDNTLHYYKFCQVDEDVLLTPNMAYESNLFILTYMVTFFITVIIFTLFGINFEQASFEAASTLGTVGLSSGMFTVNSPSFLLIFASIVMVLGRLEIYVVFYGFIYAFKKPYRIISDHINMKRKR
ncbi:MAG: TrkH family potassium uptake protein [Firmicutes bacterium]|uniref:TrkH family potassium uptake protein n=1 Tax=Candidatus Scatoplasma merdavium TaxID=2840932 RepID=A0A9D9GRM6_9BACL|nr:TrkH family potassium uptake protein [Candidatus Scatoplasma merdavium]